MSINRLKDKDFYNCMINVSNFMSDFFSQNSKSDEPLLSIDLFK